MILHSDINACYASVELLYDPKLRGKPLAVCGQQERRHGIVLAKDELAKRAGVKTGMTVWQAQRLCPGLQIVPPHFERYEASARQVRAIYSQYTDRCEPFGLDESWLDLTGCLLHADGPAAAREIKDRVRRETGLTVSIGVSWNKVLAKLGSDYKKPDAVTVIDRENFRSLVWPLPAADLLMVGKRSAEELRRLGIATSDAMDSYFANTEGAPGNGRFSDVNYNSFITKLNWQFAPKWNLMLKGTYETATVKDIEELKNYRKSIGWIGSLEYYPVKSQDFRMFLAYVGKKVDYTEKCGLSDYNTNRIELGFMYRIKCY